MMIMRRRMLTTLFLWSSSCFLVNVVILVTASKDSGYYPAGTYNPNVNTKMYWRDSSNVLEDLNQFSKLYVKYHTCAWSPYAGNFEGGGDGGDEHWYMGATEIYRANVGFSLYGILVDDNKDKKCGSATYINSFFTTAGASAYIAALQSAGAWLYGDDDAVIADDYGVTFGSPCVSRGDGGGDGGNDQNNNQQNDNGEEYVSYYSANANAISYGLGCSKDKDKSNPAFVIQTFNGTTCNAGNLWETVDTLATVNTELVASSCVAIYDSSISLDVATTLLSYSAACNLREYPGGACPDPYGKLTTYTKKLEAVAYRSPFSNTTKEKQRNVASICLLMGAGLLACLSCGIQRCFLPKETAAARDMSSTDKLSSSSTSTESGHSNRWQRGISNGWADGICFPRNCGFLDNTEVNTSSSSTSSSSSDSVPVFEDESERGTPQPLSCDFIASVHDDEQEEDDDEEEEEETRPPSAVSDSTSMLRELSRLSQLVASYASETINSSAEAVRSYAEEEVVAQDEEEEEDTIRVVHYLGIASTSLSRNNHAGSNDYHVMDDSKKIGPDLVAAPKQDVVVNDSSFGAPMSRHNNAVNNCDYYAMDDSEKIEPDLVAAPKQDVVVNDSNFGAPMSRHNNAVNNSDYYAMDDCEKTVSAADPDQDAVANDSGFCSTWSRKNNAGNNNGNMDDYEKTVSAAEPDQDVVSNASGFARTWSRKNYAGNNHGTMDDCEKTVSAAEPDQDAVANASGFARTWSRKSNAGNNNGDTDDCEKTVSAAEPDQGDVANASVFVRTWSRKNRNAVNNNGDMDDCEKTVSAAVPDQDAVANDSGFCSTWNRKNNAGSNNGNIDDYEKTVSGAEPDRDAVANAMSFARTWSPQNNAGNRHGNMDDCEKIDFAAEPETDAVANVSGFCSTWSRNNSKAGNNHGNLDDCDKTDSAAVPETDAVAIVSGFVTTWSRNNSAVHNDYYAMGDSGKINSIALPDQDAEAKISSFASTGSRNHNAVPNGYYEMDDSEKINSIALADPNAAANFASTWRQNDSFDRNHSAKMYSDAVPDPYDAPRADTNAFMVHAAAAAAAAVPDQHDRFTQTNIVGAVTRDAAWSDQDDAGKVDMVTGAAAAVDPAKQGTGKKKYKRPRLAKISKFLFGGGKKKKKQGRPLLG